MNGSYEFDFHPVGDASRSGDAITAKITTEGNSQVFVIDGGNSESGVEVSAKIKEYYGTDTVDHLILTHPDDDHSSGLREIIDKCDVRKIWINRPWLYTESLIDRFKHNWTASGLEKELRASFPIVNEIEEKALDLGISIESPLQGKEIGPFIVLSPSKSFYLDLLPQMTRTPEPANEEKLVGVMDKQLAKLLKAGQALRKIVYSAFESWEVETLDDEGETSASNESSTILYGVVDDRRVLITGDAGQTALTQAADYAEALQLPLCDFSMVAIPHHGSRRNIGPSLLNRLIGEIIPQDSASKFTAIASAAKDDKDHPRRVVMNAFKRRGGRTYTTEGKIVLHKYNSEIRPGFTSIDETPLYTNVEE